MTRLARTRMRRRAALRAGGLTAVSLATGCTLIGRAAGCATAPAEPLPRSSPLRADAEHILDLPAGFSCRVLQRFGELMSDGYRVPGRPDAMACFPRSDGALVLMRNHELTVLDDGLSPYLEGRTPPPEAYDPRAPGGVTRLVIDPKTLEVKSSNLVLAGTYWNCSGGISPWGFLSCEETTDAGHGYVFLCPVDAEHVAPARRIPSYGRFRHEAASVHAATLITYLTEDEWDGAFYRFIPSSPSDPWQGQLQAMRLRDGANPDTGPLVRGASLPIDWVDIDDPEASTTSVREQARAKGAAIVRRGEGLWIAGDDVYFTATAGGPLELGQVFRLHVGEPDTLHVLTASDNPETLDMPDAVCVAPNGRVYVAEDGANGNYLRRIDEHGRVTTFARNARSLGELAGVCFSPDGKTMFVNLQADQLTLAVSGPFDAELPGERAAAAAPAGGLGSAFAALALAVLTRGQALGR